MWALQGSRKRVRGTVRVAGQDPADLGAEARRALVGLVPQTAADLLYLETRRRGVLPPPTARPAPPGTARALLERLAPGIDRAAHPRDLSEGQRLALVLAVVLTAQPSVICLDEPTRGLDYPGKARAGRDPRAR